MCVCVPASTVVKISIFPAVIGVFTLFPGPVCIGTITVVTPVGFTQIAEQSEVLRSFLLNAKTGIYLSGGFVCLFFKDAPLNIKVLV